MKDKTHLWDPNFYQQSPLFTPIRELARQLGASHPDSWPGLDDYQHLLDNSIHKLQTESGAPVRFVTQGGRPEHFEQHYEPRIYLSGEIQTRTGHWHDFFQVLIWSQFPQTKIQLNTLHYHAALKRNSERPRQTNRSRIENTITLFDECGIIIASADTELLELIRNFQWKELFWQRRDQLAETLDCIIFGHALYEKALHPYIGMTANALLVNTDHRYQHWSQQQKMAWLDQHVSDAFKHAASAPAQLLTPFPLLGLPDWIKGNNTEAFYDNSAYFRPRATAGRPTTTHKD